MGCNFKAVICLHLTGLLDARSPLLAVCLLLNHVVIDCVFNLGQQQRLVYAFMLFRVCLICLSRLESGLTRSTYSLRQSKLPGPFSGPGNLGCNYWNCKLQQLSLDLVDHRGGAGLGLARCRSSPLNPTRKVGGRPDLGSGRVRRSRCKACG